MKYWWLVCSLFLIGCGEAGTTNVVGDADAAAIAEYEAAIAEADKLAGDDVEFEE